MKNAIHGDKCEAAILVLNNDTDPSIKSEFEIHSK
jgi:hypothetical protein